MFEPRVIEFNGESKTVREWADKLGISKAALRDRIGRRGFPIERALTQGKIANLSFDRNCQEIKSKHIASLKASEKFHAHLKDLNSLPQSKRGISHRMAKHFSFRSPDGVVYHGKNIRHFVRVNKHLLPAHATIENKKGETLASSGLNKLKPTCSSPVGSWHGWTWYSGLEDKLNKGKDLLERNPNED